MLRRKKTLLVVILALSVAVASVMGVYLNYVSLPQHAGIVLSGELGLYEDAACTVPIVSYDWGSALNISDVLTKTVYLKNEGTTTVYLGWNATGFAGHDGVEYSDANFKYSMKQKGVAWGIGGTDLPLAAGAALDIEMRLEVKSGAIGGSEIDFVLYVTAYSTPTG